jgi:PAS domain S-box-containing protein
MTALPELVADDTHIAVILADASGKIRSWNAGAEALFGHGADVALAHRVDLVVPHAYRDMHWAGFNRTMGTAWSGHDAWSDIDGLHQNGSLVPLQVLLTPMRNADGFVHGVFAMFRRRPATA